ncbi:hypothetical protein R3P38DRAFT_2924910 [Favolaschia claudopus]|uniref:Uncharacterized protein n=1 Tax=Favolaschia claudopus TaxID=2862362 RepID=A0AAW0C1Z4_9AGAR
MVATRKAPVAPVPPGSRSNSTQAVPRAAKPKPPSSSLATESDKDSAATAKNAPAATTASPKSHSKSKHKNKQHKKTTKPSSSWLDRLVYLSLSLFALYAFTTCPRDSTLSNPICRSLSQYRIHVLEPYILPPIYRTLEHPSVAPYVEKAQHVQQTVLRPAFQKSAPYVKYAKRAAWDRTLVPAFHTYVAPQYRKHILPQYNKHVLPQYRKHIAPHVERVTPHLATAQRNFEHAAFVLHKTYSTRVAPFISDAYALSRPYVIKGYRTVQPHVITLYVVVAEKAGAARRAYVDPHVVRIWDKVLELSGAGPVGSPTGEAIPVPIKEPESTVASSDEKTTPVSSETSVQVDVEVTPVEAPSSVAPSAEEEVPVPTPSTAVEVSPSSSSLPVPAEASPVVPPAEASSDVPVASSASATTDEPPSYTVDPENKEEILAALSAASIAVESARARKSPVVEEILAEVNSAVQATSSAPVETTSSSSVAPSPSAAIAVDENTIEELSAAASIASQSAHGMETPVVEEILAEVEPPVEEDDSDLSGFLDDIGLSDDMFVDDSQFISDIPPDADEDIELTPEEIEALQAQQAKEQTEAKVRNTRDKRADLEGRMAKSFTFLDELVKEQEKELRRVLVGVRKKAVSKMDDPRTEVGAAVPNARKEGDRMVAGLESYLKKDIKVGKGNAQERLDRFDTVVSKVELKLGESISQAQLVLQTFHAEEKAEEVERGMNIIQDVKNACSQAQGDVGLELSWLDDVTYKDWEVYHKLAKVGENFQATASAIQGGTHEHPPVDPFLVRLDELQTSLTTLVNELIVRIEALKEQARQSFTAQPESVKEVPTTEDVPEPVSQETESEAEVKDPEVSILPVPPVSEPEIVDPAQVIIGKSAEQVEEAVRMAEAHEEL